MTTTTHLVQARNLYANDQIELLGLMHTITSVTTNDERTMVVSEYQDEIGSIVAETPFLNNERVRVHITQD